MEDLGSTNGTFLNGRRIEGIGELTTGDQIRFGNTVWRLARVTVGGGRADSGGEMTPGAQH